MRLSASGLCLSALSAALLLSACGGGGGDDTTPPAVEPPPVETPAPDADAPPPPIPLAVFEQLEKDGVLPVLDRSNTLRGENFDQNLGVRADVKTYIDTNFNQTVPQQRAAVQFARAVQAQIDVDLEDEDAIQNVLDNIAKSTMCLSRQFDGDRDADVVISDIEAISANTYARMIGFLAFSEAVDGTVLALPSADEGVCDE